MQNNTTELEIIMRSLLIEMGLVFDEQVKIRYKLKNYILDFVIYLDFAKIVVECDGYYHQFLEDIQQDFIRDQHTIELGFDEILRFTTRQLRGELQEVKSIILQTIERLDLKYKNDTQRQNNKEIIEKLLNNQAASMNYYKQIDSTVKVYKINEPAYLSDKQAKKLKQRIEWNRLQIYNEQNTSKLSAYEIVERDGGELEKKGMNVIKMLSNMDKQILKQLILQMSTNLCTKTLT